ncbi:class I SAM-dependent methyltransferase [Nitrosomonas sp. Nm34]|uniref:methyltransferase n=1 Tax=Nitrosomonas sp. Nm34 TaxID=1881055 RepID=UPI0008EF2386|nr:class I SAM-dependent methyltransferase [Nitrosomonas sp. Nm34]SFJ03916.1 Methylase of polypeptide chain release factors [Nitrosomonas sp. Nm34]
MSDYPVISWNEAGIERSARWYSEKGMPAPRLVRVIDDRMTADAAYRLVCEGTALLWKGDFQNARQLLQALARRVDKKRPAHKTISSTTELFHRYRQTQSQRARILGSLLIPFNADHSIPLRRAPDVRFQCFEAYGPRTEAYIASLCELQGLIGAFEWRKKGIALPALGGRIYPHYGVFAPIRSEYVDLVMNTPLPRHVTAQSVAFDIGTGTGILAAVLAHRGFQHIVATDLDARAINCAHENLTQLGITTQVDLVQTNLFPEGQASLIVCNPPWIPARPSSSLEHAIFDPGSRMLWGFLHGLSLHLASEGEGWLILSDFAEHLGLRTRAELLAAIDAAGLRVLSKSDVKPYHKRVADTSDPLHAARAAELTSLWRLAAK